MNFPDIMEAYALDPTPEHLESLHRAIMSAPNYDPLVTVGQIVAPLVRAGDHQGIIHALWHDARSSDSSARSATP